MYQQNMFFLRISCGFGQFSELRFGYLDFCPVHWSDFCGDEDGDSLLNLVHGFCFGCGNFF